MKSKITPRTRSKITPRARIAALCRSLKEEGKRIVFTNGCFDLLHAGHVRYLQQAGQWGDHLIVGLNSDRSVKQIKGSRRPLIPQEQRAEVLAALACVGQVVLFDEPDPYSLIQEVRPDVLVKGADWPEEKIVGADLVLSYGGVVRRVELVPELSTTQILKRIIDRYGSGLPPEEIQ